MKTKKYLTKEQSYTISVTAAEMLTRLYCTRYQQASLGITEGDKAKRLSQKR